MAGLVHCVALEGLAAQLIEIEVDVSHGMPATVIVGLADASVAEARDRVRSAIVNTIRKWPEHRVTINLAPSAVPKTGTQFDLAIALAVAMAMHVAPEDGLASTIVLGELALDGRVRSVPGILPSVLAARKQGFRRVMVPRDNHEEAALVSDLEVVSVVSLAHALAVMSGHEYDESADHAHEQPRRLPEQGAMTPELSMNEVHGQLDAQIAAVVAAAGGHHLMMVGPPGVGKTMIAARMRSILPDLAAEEALEVSAVHSLAGSLPHDHPLIRRPPFCDPHHTASAASIVGGGHKTIRPGAMGLAHRGILFFDEAPEFASNVLEALRQPLESQQVMISRASGSAVFPAAFQLVLSANPCPCGYFGSRHRHCECTALMRRRYGDKLSGPIRDRIDIQRTLTEPSATSLTCVDNGQLRQIIARAWSAQARRTEGLAARRNGQVTGVHMRRHWPMDPETMTTLDRHVASGKLSARAADRVLRVGWTIADLLGRSAPEHADLEAALDLRRGTPVGGPLRELVSQ